VNKIYSDRAYPFPTEYGVSGWFRWSDASKQPWHLAFRLTINDENINKDVDVLGDRGLTTFVGDKIYALATYTYTNMNGAGNPNVYKTINYGTELTKWHFIYFGYTKKDSRAFGFIQFESRKETVDFP
jgi:hypothetical protein